MNLGSLDRRAVLYRSDIVVASGGAVKRSLVPVQNLYVTQGKPRSTATTAAERDTQQNEATFMSRWFDGLSTGMFLAVEGRTYRIVWFNEIGRREGYQMLGREDT